MTLFQEIVREKVPLLAMKSRNICTIDDSHHTGTTEIVQQLKVVPHHSETYLLTIFFTHTLFGPLFSFLCCLQCSLQHF